MRAAEMVGRALGFVLLASQSSGQVTVGVTEEAQLLPLGATDWGLMGAFMAVEGNTALVGGFRFQGSGPDGTFVFVRENGVWQQETRLSPLSGPLDFDGRTVALGATSGGLYLFERGASSWIPQGQLVGNAVSDVDLDGNTLAVGSWTGRVYIYVRSGSSWNLQRQLNGHPGDDGFGSRIDVEDDTLVVGAPGEAFSDTYAGKVYVYTRTGTTWQQSATLIASDAAPGDVFGSGLALQRDTLLVGAPGRDDAGEHTGAVYVFEELGNAWMETSKLLASDAGVSRSFGAEVILCQDLAVIGAPGVGGDVYAFTRQATSWVEGANFRGSAPYGGSAPSFGGAMDIDDTTLVVGAPGTNYYTGIGYAFSLDLPAGVVCEPTFELLTPLPDELLPGETAHAQVRAVGVEGAYTASLRVSYGGAPFVDVPLAPAGGDVFDVTFPPPVCAPGLARFYLALQTVDGEFLYPRPGAPLVALVGRVASVLRFEMEADDGWIGGLATDTATAGAWVRGDPNGTRAQPEDDHTPSGTDCWFTGQGAPGGPVDAADVDGGETTLLSPPLDLTGYADPWIEYRRWFANGVGGGRDALRVAIENPGGGWVDVEAVTSKNGSWTAHRFRVADFVVPSAPIRLRFVAEDSSFDSIVEAAVDDVVVFELVCDEAPPDCNGNGIDDTDDVASGRSTDADSDWVPDECAAPGAATCFGVGCPCGNDDAAAGCVNSTGSGARLSASGTASLTADDLALVASGCPPFSTSLLHAGDSAQSPPALLGDGLGCSQGTVLTYLPGVVDASGLFVRTGISSAAPPGALVPGMTWLFQALYRDPGGPCGTGANLTNAYSVAFQP